MQHGPDHGVELSYYSHDTAQPGHTLASENEFAGKLNRHSECSDCHNPHNLNNAPSSYDATTATWSLSGAYGSVSGVAPTASATGLTYTFLDGSVSPITREYQLCLKCHSGNTALPANDPAKPSRDFTDVGHEFDPANKSFHPVEAPGTNQSQKMADSLAGTSPYKIWSLKTTDTVRCVMCHSTNTIATTTPATASLDAHASTDRGILIRPYEDRTLNARGAVFNPASSALCLTCHAVTPYQSPYNPDASTATNFNLHGMHTANIRTRGSVAGDIDTPGAGMGNALCAECHFRSHSTAEPAGKQTLSGTGLVNFAPDVTPNPTGLGPTFTKTATGGTCTLTCHGKVHVYAQYVS